MADTPSYKCPYCGMVSYGKNDLESSYCGSCKSFTDNKTTRRDPTLWRKRWLRYDAQDHLWFLADDGKWCYVDTAADQLPTHGFRDVEHLESEHGPTTLLWWADSDTCETHDQSRCTLCSRNDGMPWCSECINFNHTGMHAKFCSFRVRTKVRLPE